MLAAVYESFGDPLYIARVTDPTPSRDGAVIRVDATGVCRSDWHGWMGHDAEIDNLPHVPGHEMAGTVESNGPDVNGDWVGQRVTLPFVCGCGFCPTCFSGHQHICDRQFQPGFSGWGSFAEYVAVDYADVNLVRLPDEIDSVSAAILGCRFPTAFRALTQQAAVHPGEWVAIYGCGGVGLCSIMIASALGARVIAIDLNEDKLALARSFGAEFTINATLQDRPAELIRETTKGGAAVSIDALGHSSTCYSSVMSLGKRGRHVQIGLLSSGNEAPPVPMSIVIARELKIFGSHGMQAHHFHSMLSFIQARNLPIDKLLGQKITLSEAAAFLPAMAESDLAGVCVVDRFY